MAMDNGNFQQRLLQLQLYRVELTLAKFILKHYKNNGIHKLQIQLLLREIKKAISKQIPTYPLKGYPERQILEYFFQDFYPQVLVNTGSLLENLEHNKKYIEVRLNKTGFTYRIDDLENKVLFMQEECESFVPEELIASLKKNKYSGIIKQIISNGYSISNELLWEQIDNIREKELKTRSNRASKNITSEAGLKTFRRTINHNIHRTGWRIKSKNGKHEISFEHEKT
jgi:hypothetical protein